MKNDEDYRMGLIGAFYASVLEASLDPETRVMHLRTREVLKAALMTAATFLSSDPQGLTPAGRKAMGKEVARQFLNCLRGVQEAGGLSYAMGPTPIVILNDDERRQ